MDLNRIIAVIVGLGFAAVMAPGLRAQSCTSSQNAAVQCFVANSITTGLTATRYGMTVAQFETYGVAVSRILETHHTYVVLVGLSSAVADAMPPTNADGSANSSAQDSAVNSIVSSAVTNGLASTQREADLQDLQWFALDLVTKMNTNDNFIQLLTPGIGLRVIDTYVVSGTSNGTVNWTQVNSALSNAVDSLTHSGIITIPSGVTSSQVKAFVNSLAQTIYTYKTATGRKTL
jgi:hypothetical protein